MKMKKFLMLTIFTLLTTLCMSTQNIYAYENLDKVHFLETKGYGDAIILQSNGVFALIDCGEDFQENADYIVNFLKSLGANKLDYFIMSHAHSDHIGSFEKLSKLIQIDKFIGMDLGIEKDSILRDDSNSPIPNSHPLFDNTSNSWLVPEIEVGEWNTDIYYQKMLLALSDQGIEKNDTARFIIPKENDSIKIGNYTLKFNNTFSKIDDIPLIKKNFNASSTWITLSKDNIKVALTGDILGTQAEHILNNNPYTNNVDLYKISHHCRTGNTTENMILKLNPSISIAMGTPNSTPISKLLALHNSKVYFTNENNNLISATILSNKIVLDDDYKVHDEYLSDEWIKFNNKCYYYENNTPVKNDWRLLNNIIYRFDSNGIMMQNEWFKDNNNTHYFDNNGHLVINDWYLINGYYYRFDETGKMIEGQWFKNNNKYYYLDKNGIMLSDCWKLINNKWYRFNSDGTMLSNKWFQDFDNNWYWLSADGSMASNSWNLINNKWYRFGTNGVMLQDEWFLDSNNKWYWLTNTGSMASNSWSLINNKWYRFGTNGVMLQDEWFLDSNNKWYWLTNTGSMTSNNWSLINNKWYRFGTNGVMLQDEWFLDSNNKWYWLTNTGSMASNSWNLINNKWYRFASNGIMLQNEWFLDSNSKWYYLKSDGDMASNESIEINGIIYMFNDNGIMI